MGRLAQTEGLTEAERDILATVREFMDREIIPVASELEHNDEYPAEIVAGMKRLGLFGLQGPGGSTSGLGVSLLPTPWSWRSSPAAGCRCPASSTPTSSWRT